jgi:hypothetical protein
MAARMIGLLLIVRSGMGNAQLPRRCSDKTSIQPVTRTEQLSVCGKRAACLSGRAETYKDESASTASKRSASVHSGRLFCHAASAHPDPGAPAVILHPGLFTLGKSGYLDSFTSLSTTIFVDRRCSRTRLSHPGSPGSHPAPIQRPLPARNGLRWLLTGAAFAREIPLLANVPTARTHTSGLA